VTQRSINTLKYKRDGIVANLVAHSNQNWCFEVNVVECTV